MARFPQRQRAMDRRTRAPHCQIVVVLTRILPGRARLVMRPRVVRQPPVAAAAGSPHPTILAEEKQQRGRHQEPKKQQQKTLQRIATANKGVNRRRQSQGPATHERVEIRPTANKQLNRPRHPRNPSNHTHHPASLRLRNPATRRQLSRPLALLLAQRLPPLCCRCAAW